MAFWQSDSRTSTITDSCSRCNNSATDAYLQGSTIHSKTRSDLPGTPASDTRQVLRAIHLLQEHLLELRLVAVKSEELFAILHFSWAGWDNISSRKRWWLLACHLLEAQHHWRILSHLGRHGIRCPRNHDKRPGRQAPSGNLMKRRPIMMSFGII